MKHLTRIYRWIEGRLTSQDQYHDTLEAAHEHLAKHSKLGDTVKIYDQDLQVVHNLTQNGDTYA